MLLPPAPPSLPVHWILGRDSKLVKNRTPSGSELYLVNELIIKCHALSLSLSLSVFWIILRATQQQLICRYKNKTPHKGWKWHFMVSLLYPPKSPTKRSVPLKTHSTDQAPNAPTRPNQINTSNSICFYICSTSSLLHHRYNFSNSLSP